MNMKDRVKIDVKSHGLQYMFDINEPQSNPESLDMSNIIPVIDMSMGGHALLHDSDKYLSADGRSGSNLVGVQSKTFRVLTYGNASGADPQVVVPLNHHFISWGMKCMFYTNAAGAAAINNKWGSIELELFPGVGAVPAVKFIGEFLGSSLKQQYAFNITREFLQIVPAGSYCQLSIWLHDGSVFPAATELKYTLIGQAVPVGAVLPLGV